MSKQFLIFGDIETGGLNGRLDNGRLGMEYYPIFEIAIIVTDTDLNQVGDALRVVVYQDDIDIAMSHEWALKTHTESGLLREVQASGTTLKDAEQVILDYLEGLGVAKYNRKNHSGGIFVGNSIMFDRSFIMCQMPELHDYMHYRQLDISALALAARFWNPEVEQEVREAKQYAHEALADIKESIDELRIYKRVMFPNSEV